MRIKNLVIIALCSVSLFKLNGQVSTQQLSGGINPITTSVPFLLIAPDSRQGGMGEVGAATQPDVNSIHWNCSKLAFAEKNMGFGISYTPWLRQLVPDISLSYLSFYKKVSKMSAFGASMRYFSLGNITFTDIQGNTTGQFKPNEFAVDLAYSQKLSQTFAAGLAIRYINSNLTGGVTLSNGQPTKAGQSVAVDVGVFYKTKPNFKVEGKKTTVTGGLAITNIGTKISYTTVKNFIPINLRLGGGYKIDIDDYNTFGVYLDFNKLLVPTPPVYQRQKTISGADSNAIAIDQATGAPIIESGKDPNRAVAAGMFGSFNDAPGGAKEELKEVNIAIGFEYWYAKQFAVRAGYFYEDKTKGGRQFFNIGLGVRYSVFGLDMAYLIPTTLRNPLQNTLRFTLTFDLDAFKSQNKETTGAANPTP
ncbi:MAG: type IX secretion system outer membrane channel protein PorV [Sphingobacteriaceae bacterium]|nr:type IX secretion system outer membrane channel protein PorV [Sphingobacteriaceae bacterium]